MKTKKITKIIVASLMLMTCAVSLAGCEDVSDWSLSMRSKLGDLPLKISTYDMEQ